MKKAEIQIGGVYRAKVSDRLTDVRIDAEHPGGGWTATNLATKKKVRIKSAQRLRAPAGGSAAHKATGAATAATGVKDKAKATDPSTSPRAATLARPGGEDGRKPKGILDVAAQILAEAKEPMGCKAIVEQAIEQKLWSTNGKTPAATLYAAIIREIANKGDDARFEKVDRGLFVAAPTTPTSGKEV